MEDGNIANKVVIDDHITVTEGDNTTTITGDTVSTTTLSGTLDAESMKNSLTAEAVQNVVPMAWSVGDSGAHVDANHDGGIAIGKDAYSVGNSGIAIGPGTRCAADNTITFGAQFTETTNSGNVTHTCTTEGTGSITIGAGLIL